MQACWGPRKLVCMRNTNMILNPGLATGLPGPHYGAVRLTPLRIQKTLFNTSQNISY